MKKRYIIHDNFAECFFCILVFVFKDIKKTTDIKKELIMRKQNIPKDQNCSLVFPSDMIKIGALALRFHFQPGRLINAVALRLRFPL